MGEFLNGLGTTIGKLGTGIGDFIGLDGKFGLGGGNNSFSLANMGDAFKGVLGMDADVTKNFMPGQVTELPSVFNTDAVNTALAKAGGGASKGLIGDMGLKDILSTGISGYKAMTQSDLAKKQISLANQAYADQKALSDRNVKKQDEYDAAIADAWTASLAKGQ